MYYIYWQVKIFIMKTISTPLLGIEVEKFNEYSRNWSYANFVLTLIGAFLFGFNYLIIAFLSLTALVSTFTCGRLINFGGSLIFQLIKEKNPQPSNLMQIVFKAFSFTVTPLLLYLEMEYSFSDKAFNSKTFLAILLLLYCFRLAVKMSIVKFISELTFWCLVIFNCSLGFLILLNYFESPLIHKLIKWLVTYLAILLSMSKATSSLWDRAKKENNEGTLNFLRILRDTIAA